MKVIHSRSGITLGNNLKVAASFWQRLRGYMLYSSPPSTFDGIYFANSNMVHNSFVRFPIDVIFISKSNTVVKVLRGFRPWQFSQMYLRAAHVIEFPAGTVFKEVLPGDLLKLEN